MSTRRRRMAMIVAIVLAALMILSVVLPAILTEAVTQNEINAKKKEIEALRDAKKKTQGEIDSLKGKRNDIIQLKTLYDDQIAMVSLEIELTTELISDINAAIAARRIELADALAREEEMAQLYIDRVRAMESMGDISYLGILLQAESLTEFLTRWDAVREIMKRDKQLADDLLAERVGIEAMIEELEESKREEYENRRELASRQTELADLSAEAQDMMNELVAEMAEAESKLKDEDKRLADAIKEEEDMKKEWDRIQAELERARQRNSQFVGGEYRWPVPGYEGVISSGWGNRLHPIYKVYRHHSGIDIPAPKGTSIVAANAGEVIVRAKASGYGNYIVIDHGGGQSTLYAHMNGFGSYQVGAKVKAGDTIGYVGTTGLSTGNHLHFEIRINGQDVDPVPYLKG